MESVEEKKKNSYKNHSTNEMRDTFVQSFKDKPESGKCSQTYEGEILGKTVLKIYLLSNFTNFTSVIIFRTCQ